MYAYLKIERIENSLQSFEFPWKFLKLEYCTCTLKHLKYNARCDVPIRLMHNFENSTQIFKIQVMHVLD